MLSYRYPTYEELIAPRPPSNEFIGFQGLELLPGFHEETEELEDLFNLQMAIVRAPFLFLFFRFVKPYVSRIRRVFCAMDFMHKIMARRLVPYVTLSCFRIFLKIQV